MLKTQSLELMLILVLNLAETLFKEPFIQISIKKELLALQFCVGLHELFYERIKVILKTNSTNHNFLDW